MLVLNIIIFLVILILVIMILPVFLIYPGMYYGRWKSFGPVFSFRSLDGTELEGVIYEPRKKGMVLKDTIILYFHGNNLNLGSRTPFFMQVIEKLGVTIVSIDYRGFGNSKGFPSESGIIKDAQSIYDHINNDKRYTRHRKIIMGKSLGGAVAIALAQKVTSWALIVENTFLNVREVANDSYGILRKIPEGVKDFLLVDNRWDSQSRIQTIKNIPQLFLVGSSDKVIPPRHMKKLFELSLGPKKIIEYPLGRHTDLYKQDGYFEDISTFLNVL